MASTVLLPFEDALAQIPHVPEWSPSAKLYEVEPEYEIFDPTIVADQAGVVHAVWRALSTKLDGDEELLYYARLENGVWSNPIDIRAASPTSRPTMAIDSTGNIHVLWVSSGRMLYYTRASVADALSAQKWSEPIMLDEANLRAQIKVDSQDQLHVVYARYDSDGPYHMVSSDSGKAWSRSTNIASAQFGSSADFVHLSITTSGVLHVVWTEFASPDGWPPTGLYYSHSLDGGNSWSTAFQLADEGFNQVNVLALDGNSVHVVWNGMAGIHGRYHRWSKDGGDTWSDTTTLQTAGVSGSTGPPAIVADSTGVVHVVITDNDSPERACLLYTSWQNQQWTTPKCISDKLTTYLEEPTMTLASGNQLHALYWTDRRFLWHVVTEIDAPPVAPSPFSSATPATDVQEIEVSQTVISPSVVIETQPQKISLRDLPASSKPPNPNTPIMVGMIAAGLTTILALMFRLFHQNRR